MKICCKCKIQKPLDNFNKNKARKDGHATMCRECWKVYYKENYYLRGNERKRLREKNLKVKYDIREFIKIKKDVPCMDCGTKYPYYVMDFDHRDTSQKKFNISEMAVIGSWKLLKEEIEKCDVVCSNCHRERTHGNNAE
jgi:hypothetical protein